MYVALCIWGIFLWQGASHLQVVEKAVVVEEIEEAVAILDNYSKVISDEKYPKKNKKDPANYRNVF